MSLGILIVSLLASAIFAMEIWFRWVTEVLRPNQACQRVQ
jgi:hypothetical protein